MNLLIEGEGGPTFKLWGGSWVPLLNFKGGPGIPLLNFRGVPDLTFKFWGGSRSHFYTMPLNIGFWHGILIWKWWIFNLITLNSKTVLQTFGKGFRFPENLFQSSSNENVQNFYWLSQKNMPISQTEGYFKNLKIPTTVF